jgi:hypothetical protein
MSESTPTETTAIAEYRPTEAALTQLREQYGASVWVVDTPDRMAAAKKARGEIRKWRLDLEAERKRIKAPALERCKEIDTEAKRIAAELLKLETPVADAIKEVEQAKKRGEEEKERAEEERITKHRAEIDRIRALPVTLLSADQEQLRAGVDELEALDVSTMEEFAGVGQSAQSDTLVRLREMLRVSIEAEEEQARIAKEREELEQLRAEQAERDRIAKEKQDAEDKERRAKLDAEEKEAQERRAAEDALAREAREKADTEARELRAKQETEARKTREAEEKRLASESEKLEAERRVDEERRQKAEAIEREAEHERAMRLDARGMLETFLDRYGHLKEFVVVASAIESYFESYPVADKD